LHLYKGQKCGKFQQPAKNNSNTPERLQDIEQTEFTHAFAQASHKIMSIMSYQTWCLMQGKQTWH